MGSQRVGHDWATFNSLALSSLDPGLWSLHFSPHSFCFSFFFFSLLHFSYIYIFFVCLFVCFSFLLRFSAENYTGFYFYDIAFSSLWLFSCQFSNLIDKTSQCCWGNTVKTFQTFFGKSIWEWGSCWVLSNWLWLLSHSIPSQQRQIQRLILDFPAEADPAPNSDSGSGRTRLQQRWTGEQANPLQALCKEWVV